MTFLDYTFKTNFIADPEISFQNDWEVKPETDLINFKRNDESYHINLHTSEHYKVFPLQGNKFLVKKSFVLYLVSLENKKISWLVIPYKNFYIAKNGVYVISKLLYFYDFESFEECYLLDHSTGDIIFCKGFIIQKFSYYSNIYVNEKDLPDNFTIEMANSFKVKVKIKHLPISFTKIKVHFKDRIEYICTGLMQYFQSKYIDDQMENSEEIYVDLNSEDFNVSNLETLKYLKSDLVRSFYWKEIMNLLN